MGSWQDDDRRTSCSILHYGQVMLTSFVTTDSLQNPKEVGVGSKIILETLTSHKHTNKCQKCLVKGKKQPQVVGGEAMACSYPGRKVAEEQSAELVEGLAHIL
jgi:hypothetical protein